MKGRRDHFNALTPRQIQSFSRMYRDLSWSTATIGARFGIDRVTVGDWAAKLGLPPRRPVSVGTGDHSTVDIGR